MAADDKGKLKAQWPEVHNQARNLPISNDHAAVQSKVILCVEACAGLPRIPEIHVALPGVADEACHVLRRPQRHSLQKKMCRAPPLAGDSRE